MTFADFLTSLRTFLFPYRTHLESEVEYLRAQLAQRQRRVDELQEAIQEAMTPPPAAPREPRSVPQPLAPANTGWEGFRANRKAKEKASEEAVS